MHDPQRTLESLKALRLERGETSPFTTHTDFLRWADQAAPLLAFDPTLAADFKGSASAATTVRTWKPDKYVPALNNAIGTVNRAIALLEHQSTPETTPQVQSSPPKNTGAPEKLTLKWMYEHAPWSFYAWLLGSVSAAFVLGFSASEALTKMNKANLSVAEPTTTKPTTASPPNTAASTP